MTVRLVVPLAATLTLFACPGGGERPGSDAGTQDNATAANGLFLTSGSFLNLNIPQRSGEKKVSGEINVEWHQPNGDKPYATNAAVTVNGTALPSTPLGFSLGGVDLSAAGPGSTLTVTATGSSPANEAPSSTTLAVPCPDDVVITAPAAGVAVGVGDQVTVTWQGQTKYPGFWTSSVEVHPMQLGDVNLGGVDPFGPHKKLLSSGTDTSAVLTVPNVAGADAYEVELRVYGAEQNKANGRLTCVLRKRVPLAKKP